MVPNLVATLKKGLQNQWIKLAKKENFLPPSTGWTTQRTRLMNDAFGYLFLSPTSKKLESWMKFQRE